MPGSSPWVAIIGHDWREFGKLPIYEFGYWREDLGSSYDLRKTRSVRDIPFNPNHFNQNPPSQDSPNIHPMTMWGGFGDGLSGMSDVLMKAAEQGRSRLARFQKIPGTSIYWPAEYRKPKMEIKGF